MAAAERVVSAGLRGARARALRAAAAPRVRAGWVGVVLLAGIAGPCLLTLPWSLERYDAQDLAGVGSLAAPSWAHPMGTDRLGQGLLWRVMLGGAISLGVGVAAAVISVVIGVTWGAIAGYVGGRVDAAMMRAVDVLYGLPYILLVVLIDLALQPGLTAALQPWAGASAGSVANVVSLLTAIGAVSWLTMARVIRGQVLSLREQPFMEAGRCVGVGPVRLLVRYLLPNLVGPIVVYATLAVPQAILQESFLSFLGIGVAPPTPSWGNLASDGLDQLYVLLVNPAAMRWWVLVWPCALLALTLLGLNLVGDALRDRLDPRRGEVR